MPAFVSTPGTWSYWDSKLLKVTNTDALIGNFVSGPAVSPATTYASYPYVDTVLVDAIPYDEVWYLSRLTAWLDTSEPNPFTNPVVPYQLGAPLAGSLCRSRDYSLPDLVDVTEAGAVYHWLASDFVQQPRILGGTGLSHRLTQATLTSYTAYNGGSPLVIIIPNFTLTLSLEYDVYKQS